jgi:hypothetical protein
MLSINKQDVLKTILIIWFFATTVYVAYDLYAGYKIRGMQAAYQQGYATSIDDLIKKTKASNCQSFEVKKDDQQIQIVDAQCQQQAQAQAQAPAQAQAQVPVPAVKK